MTSEEREQFIADRLAAVRSAVSAVVEEFGPDDRMALAMAHGWNAMRAGIRREAWLGVIPQKIRSKQSVSKTKKEARNE